ncbi:MAG: hypothetical protein IKJ35_05535 [Clostridia bacterium]|nr:hypothetical protein [Clostridia bacterium]
MLQKEYWRTKLSPADQKTYDLIRAGLASQRERTAIPTFSGDPNGILPIYQAIWNDHPELYWQTYAPGVAQAASSFGGLFGSGGAPRFEVIHPTLYQPKETASINASIRNVLAKLDALKAQPKIDQIIAAILHLAKHVTYEINNEKNQNAASALYFGRAQCTGYAKAFKLMMDHLGIPCILVSGSAMAREGDPSSMGPHAWNLVELDGACYHLDTTAVAGNVDDREDILASLLFLGKDGDFEKNHVWDRKSIPACPNHSPYRATKIIPSPGAGMPSKPDDASVTQISSLYELRMLLAREFASEKTCTFAFRMNMSLPTEKLHPHVMSSIQAALNQAKKSSSVETTCQGTLYQLTRTVSP